MAHHLRADLGELLPASRHRPVLDWLGCSSVRRKLPAHEVADERRWRRRNGTTTVSILSRHDPLFTGAYLACHPARTPQEHPCHMESIAPSRSHRTLQAATDIMHPLQATPLTGVVARRISRAKFGLYHPIMRFSWRKGRNPGDRTQACDSEPRRWRLRSVDPQWTLPEVADQ
jgi:hypothetical protein